jgi:hypothetical protein
MAMHPRNEDKTSMLAFDQTVAHNLALLEEIKLRQHPSRSSARAAVAREAKILPGTYENIRRRRTKGIRGYVGRAVEALLLRELDGELRRLEHERQIILQRGVDPRSDEVAAVLADLQKVRSVMEKMR